MNRVLIDGILVDPVQLVSRFIGRGISFKPAPPPVTTPSKHANRYQSEKDRLAARRRDVRAADRRYKEKKRNERKQSL